MTRWSAIEITRPWKKNETRVPMFTATMLPVIAHMAKEITMGMAKFTICAIPAFPLKNMNRVRFVRSSRGCKINCKRWVIETPHPTKIMAMMSIISRHSIGSCPTPCAVKNDETRPIMTLKAKRKVRLPSTRGQSIDFRSRQLKIAAIKP